MAELERPGFGRVNWSVGQDGRYPLYTINSEVYLLKVIWNDETNFNYF